MAEASRRSWLSRGRVSTDRISSALFESILPSGGINPANQPIGDLRIKGRQKVIQGSGVRCTLIPAQHLKVTGQPLNAHTRMGQEGQSHGSDRIRDRGDLHPLIDHMLYQDSYALLHLPFLFQSCEESRDSPLRGGRYGRYGQVKDRPFFWSQAACVFTGKDRI